MNGGDAWVAAYRAGERVRNGAGASGSGSGSGSFDESEEQMPLKINQVGRRCKLDPGLKAPPG